MWTNVQFNGSLAPNQTQRYFTFGWPTAWHVVWYMMPTTPVSGAPQVDWSVAVERYAADRCTYWITVANRTVAAVGFEGRYAVLS